MFMLMCCQNVFTIFALHSSYIVYVYVNSVPNNNIPKNTIQYQQI